MLNNKISLIFILGFLLSFSLFSCSSSQPENNENISAPINNDNNEGISPPNFNSDNIDYKTFEVKDTLSGKVIGWGYDIIVDGHTTIHQPIIPGVAGNKSFSTEEQAKKTGEFAVNKMKRNGGLPTITIMELDSLGIIK